MRGCGLARRTSLGCASLRARSIRCGLALTVALLLGLPAAGHVPPAELIANAIAELNRAAGRAVPIELEVDLLMGAGDAAAASGRLLSDPGGSARIELRGAGGMLERHLLRRGAGLRASRQGALVAQPRPFLPPLFLLQAGSFEALESALAALVVSSDEVALGYEGEHDCYVLGGRSPGRSQSDERAALWADIESFEVVRIDLARGARFRFGPPRSFGALRLPSWIDLFVREVRVGRLLVKSAAPARPAPDAFSDAWLDGAPAGQPPP